MGGDSDDPSGFGVNFIRWDYYKELGYPRADNFDNILDILAEMVKKNRLPPMDRRPMV